MPAFRKYIEDLRMNVKPKRCIIFSRGMGILGDIYARLMELTDYKYNDCRDAPFVINHASLLPSTEMVLARRAPEISLYLSSNKMLLGIDLDRVDVVIFLHPYNQPAALIQGGGRGGRRNESNMRRRVQVYQFFNSQDLASSNKQMSPMMREICLGKTCTRKVMKDFFIGSDEETSEELQDYTCCHNCDLQV